MVRNLQKKDQIGYTLINQDAKWGQFERIIIKAVSLPESIARTD